MPLSRSILTEFDQSNSSPCTEAKHALGAHALSAACYSLSTHKRLFTQLPRSWRRIHLCTRTSSQTWLTAARQQTYQNLIHISKEHSPRTNPTSAECYEDRTAHAKNPLLAGALRHRTHIFTVVNDAQSRHSTPPQRDGGG